MVMFNYSNLSDIEFEELVKDIMEKKLNTKLHTFSRGKDGGIDIRDGKIPYNIVIQVKHYQKSGFSALKRALEKEKSKVDKLNPNKYYICCDLELTSYNQKEIFDLFKEYMDSTDNIITLKEIEVWLTSAEVLRMVYNNNVIIDSQMMLTDIQEDSKYFVQTDLFEKCLEKLKSERIIMLVGDPGTGKTITSKMLVLYYIKLGYHIKCTTNNEISDIKRSLSTSKDVKEVILLDDCLGHAYFNMKESRENEIKSLINLVKLYPNKILIMNSRVTILNEAINRSVDFEKVFVNKYIPVSVISTDELSNLEKAKIFYNHIYFNQMDGKYFSEILKDKGYLKIVKHKNYSPRIIEFLTNHNRISNIEPEEYMNFIMDNLENPFEVWKNEFNYRLGQIDRIFLLVLHSLMLTVVDIDSFRKSFEERIKYENIDTTKNVFEECIKRLNKSMVKIVDDGQNMMIGVSNPSINDFLYYELKNNQVELDKMKRSVLYYEQIVSCYLDKADEIFLEKIKDNTYLELRNLNKYYHLENKLLALLTEKDLLLKNYEDSIYTGLLHISEINGYLSSEIRRIDIVRKFFTDPFYSFYNIGEKIDVNMVYSIVKDMYVENTIEFAGILIDRFNYEDRELEKEIKKVIAEEMKEQLNDYAQEVVMNYYDNFDYEFNFIDIVEETRAELSNDFQFSGEINNMTEEEFNEYLEEELINYLTEKTENNLYGYMKNIFEEIPLEIFRELDVSIEDYFVDENEVKEVVYSYTRPKKENGKIIKEDKSEDEKIIEIFETKNK